MFKKLWELINQTSWETVFFTHKVEDYSRIKGILNDHGVPSKTKANTSYGSSQMDGFGTTYDLLVKKKDLYKAQQAIHKRR